MAALNPSTQAATTRMLLADALQEMDLRLRLARARLARQMAIRQVNVALQAINLALGGRGAKVDLVA